MIAVRDEEGENVDTLQLADIVPEEFFPLHSNDNKADEIVGNVLYKRFEQDGTEKETEEVILLNDFVALLEAPKNCSLVLEEKHKLYPDMDIRYPTDFEQYIKSLIR